ncbi:MAG: DUF2127 domain-containing protein, partial [Verrucomicrobiota bacterium]|nr:DUF2127 domain-containing protein [Verrucomicrobiota bacterium]
GHETWRGRATLLQYRWRLSELFVSWTVSLMAANDTTKHHKHNKSLLVIAIFKFVKGCLLLALAIGLLRLLHHDVAHTLTRIANALRVDPNNRYLIDLLARAQLISDKNIGVASGLTFVYSGLFFVEGLGLFFEKVWAEFLTVIVTSLFIPLELFEIARHPNFWKIATLFINLAIVACLIWIIRKQKSSASHSKSLSHPDTPNHSLGTD